MKYCTSINHALIFVCERPVVLFMIQNEPVLLIWMECATIIVIIVFNLQLMLDSLVIVIKTEFKCISSDKVQVQHCNNLIQYA